MVEKRIRIHLRSECKLRLELPAIVGVSGGPDSLCLLHLLHEAGITCIAIHVDHSLRPSSGDEAEFVKKHCEELNIPVYIRKLDVGEFARVNRISVEEAARILRYQYLFQLAEEFDCQAVVVGHNADDQVETVLMHIIRGTGLDGLAGMKPWSLPNPWSDTIPLVRPLLNITRDQILGYCAQNDLHFVLDESNTDVNYLRNRIRQELIPDLQTYNCQFKKSMVRLSNVIQNDREFLEIAVDAAWKQVIILANVHLISLDLEELHKHHPAILRRVIRRVLMTLDKSIRDVDYDVVDRACEFFHSSNNANRLPLVAGFEVFRYRKHYIVFAREDDPLDNFWPQIPTGNPRLIPNTIDMRINSEWALKSIIQNQYTHTDDLFVAQLDEEKLEGNLIMDTFRPGDRFQPFGLNGEEIKLGDFWTKEGLPARARKNWPIVKAENIIAWVPGFRIAEQYKVTSATKKIRKLEIYRK